MAEKSSEKAVKLGPGIVSLYSPCDLATNWCAAPLTITALAIEPALMVAAVEMRGCGTPEMRPTGGTDDARIAQSVLALQSDLLAGCPAGPLFGEQLVFGLTNYLIEGYGTATPSQLRLRRGGLGRGRERRLKDYIEANIDEPLHITTLSTLVGLSPYHLGRMFKLETGLTLHQYVIARRIAAATRLLATKMTLTEVHSRQGSQVTAILLSASPPKSELPPRRFVRHGPGRQDRSPRDARRLRDWLDTRVVEVNNLPACLVLAQNPR